MRSGKHLLQLGLVVSALLLAEPGRAQFYSLERDDVTLIYTNPLQRYLLPHTIRTFETSLRFHRRLLGFEPYDRVTLFLHDFRDTGNAGATAVPRNFVRVSISPFRYTYETVMTSERMSWIMNHELVHVAAGDMSTKTDRFFRTLFAGKVNPVAEQPLTLLYAYLTAPRHFAPRWYHEGAAVFLETWMAGGLGRGLGAYDEMVFRTHVRDRTRIYDFVGLESEGTTIDFQVGVNSYLYGTRFMSYLADQYGPQSVIDWIARKDGTRRYFAGQFRKVYGKPLKRAWKEWIDWERSFQSENLASVRNNPVTTNRNLAGRPLGSVSRGFLDPQRGRLYTAIRYPGQVAHIAAIDLETAKVTKLADIKGAALFYVCSLAYDPASSTLFYTTDNLDWRDLVALDLQTGQTRQLLKDARIGDLAFNSADRSVWGVRHFNGISTIVRIPEPYTDWDHVYSWPFGNDLYDIDLSNDGKTMIGALSNISGGQRLIAMSTDSLLAGQSEFETLFDFGSSNPETFVFSPDDRYLYGSSYYSGVSNIFRFDMEERKMQAITNAETGYFRPIPLARDSLFVFTYTGKGFVPVLVPDTPISRVSAVRFLGQEVVDKHPVVRDWVVKPPTPGSQDTVNVQPSRYRPLSHVGLRSVYPTVLGYKDYAAVGLRFDLSDPIRLHRFGFQASYSPTESLPQDERFHVSGSYDFRNWSMTASYNPADFYDLFGPTKTSRRGYALKVGYTGWLIYDDPRTMKYGLNLGGYANLQRLPDAQNVSTSFSELLTASGSLDYENLRSSLGKVDDEKGIKWHLGATANYVNRQVFPLLHMETDLGFALPIGHSSIWLRTSTGVSVDRPTEPFANFYFGGFGNNWIDHREEKRYRSFYSFPGLEINEAGGNNYAKGMLEWTLPPVRFRRIGFSALYLRWARPAVFTSGLATNVVGSGEPAQFVNVGGQLDFRVILLTYMPATFSVGYAVAKEIDGRDSDEFMFSVRILGGD